jgi:CHASE2 domain-containing sensor protein
MNTFLSALDAVLCGLVVLAAAEYLRRIRPMSQMLLATSFYLVAISAFASVVNLMLGHVPTVPALLMHAGVVSYAYARRHFIFEPDWHGHERRAQERRGAGR